MANAIMFVTPPHVSMIKGIVHVLLIALIRIGISSFPLSYPDMWVMANATSFVILQNVLMIQEIVTLRIPRLCCLSYWCYRTLLICWCYTKSI